MAVPLMPRSVLDAALGGWVALDPFPEGPLRSAVTEGHHCGQAHHGRPAGAKGAL